MIFWLTGNSGSGKSTLANLIRLGNRDIINLDGDDLRKCWKLGFSEEDRREQNIRIAKIATLLEGQGFTIIVSTICPYKELRKEVKQITNCKFIYLEGGKENSSKYPYEKP